MKNKINELAKKAGFKKVGITPARIYDELVPILKRRGATPFTKKDIEKRINPFIYLKTARSVIVCLLPYFQGNNENVARYARGGDYHKPVKNRLKIIAEGLNLEKYKLLVDSGGLLDKHLAYLAGLGWFGQNNLFYSEGLGCRFYIGSILCELDISPDSPIESKCLKCKKCIKACPSGALSLPYQFNPYKCISYLTQKDNLTINEQKILKLGKYKLGCDYCQDCCPLNE